MLVESPLIGYHFTRAQVFISYSVHLSKGKKWPQKICSHANSDTIFWHSNSFPIIIWSHGVIFFVLSHFCLGRMWLVIKKIKTLYIPLGQNLAMNCAWTNVRELDLATTALTMTILKLVTVAAKAWLSLGAVDMKGLSMITSVSTSLSILLQGVSSKELKNSSLKNASKNQKTNQNCWYPIT